MIKFRVVRYYCEYNDEDYDYDNKNSYNTDFLYEEHLDAFNKAEELNKIFYNEENPFFSKIDIKLLTDEQIGNLVRQGADVNSGAISLWNVDFDVSKIIKIYGVHAEECLL